MSVSLLELHKNGTIKDLCSRGLMSTTILTYIEYYETFKRYLERGNNRTTSVKMASLDSKVTEITIWRAIRLVEHD